MAQISNIPDEAKPGLANLISLDDQTVDVLVAGIDRTPRIVSETGRATALAESFDTKHQEAMRAVLGTLISLAGVQSQLGVSPAQLARNVSRMMEASGDAALRLGDKAGEFEARLTRLLSTDGLTILAKTREVMSEHHNLFCSSRVISQIVPIFTTDLEGPPGALAILHSLRISYHEGSELRSFYVAMDGTDLKELRATLERADLKEASLKQSLIRGEIPLFQRSHEP